VKRLLRNRLFLALWVFLWLFIASRLVFTLWDLAHAPKDSSFLWASGFLVFVLVLFVWDARRSR
jgi:uncharacterized MAPEG superfamily protein